MVVESLQSSRHQRAGCMGRAATGHQPCAPHAQPCREDAMTERIVAPPGTWIDPRLPLPAPGSNQMKPPAGLRLPESAKEARKTVFEGVDRAAHLAYVGGLPRRAADMIIEYIVDLERRVT